MSQSDGPQVSLVEDVESQQLENVWTTGRKLLIAIIIGVTLVIGAGVVTIFYLSKIVALSKDVTTHSFVMRDLGLDMQNNLNRHKATLAIYINTKQEGLKTEAADIRSKLIGISNNLKDEAKTEKEIQSVKEISEKLNYTLSLGLDAVSTSSSAEINVTASPEDMGEAVDLSTEKEVVEPTEKKVVEVKTESSEANVDDIDLGLDDIDLDVGDVDLGLDDIDLGLDDIDLGLDDGLDLSIDDIDLGLDDVDLEIEDNTASVTESADVTESSDVDDEMEDLGFDLSNEAFGGVITDRGGAKVDNGADLQEYNLAIMELLDVINTQLLERGDKRIEEQNTTMDELYFFSKLYVILILSVLIAFNIGQYVYFNRSVTIPIKRLRRYLLSMGRGELPEFKMKVWKDDIGEMVKAVRNLLFGLKETAFFANELGGGNLKAEYTTLGRGDILGNALMNMRDNLRKVADDDEKRNWANSGVADFAEILRKYNDNLDNLADQIIIYLVNYIKVNQGGMFLVNDLNKNDIHMELSAIYAWDRKKFIEQRIELGQGLVGQCWYERKTIFLTDIPDEFVKITSGLGEATPKCVLIVPLVSNEEIYGVVELASFRVLDAYEVEFVEKVAESIAAAVSNVKITEKTKILLEEAQQQGEELRANEEEMRQNMEEMNATQEEMDRILQEKDQQIEQLLKDIEELKK